MAEKLSRFVRTILLLTSMFAAGTAWAAQSDIGTTGAQFLKMGAGARATGMGDAFTAVSNDATAVYWNPAGLAAIETRQATLMHAIAFEEIYYDWVSVMLPTANGGFGAGIQYLGYGSIKELDDTGAENGSFSPSDMAVNLSYASYVMSVPVGITAKYISSQIKNSAAAFAVDLGAMYELNPGLNLGAAVQNIGTKMKYISVEDPLPMTIKGGVAYQLSPVLNLAADISFPQDNAMLFGAGAEYTYQFQDGIAAVVRAGYNTRAKALGGMSGLSAGLGAKFHKYALDVSFAPMGDLGSVSRVSFGFEF